MTQTDNGEKDRERILRLINTLRTITLTVQIAPFVYSLLYIISFVVAMSGNLQLQTAFDMLFYVSPVFIVVHLIYSRILHLCIWYRTACLLPTIPQAVSLLDYYVVDLSRAYALVFNIIMIVMFSLLLVAAYNVFLSPRYARK